MGVDGTVSRHALAPSPTWMAPSGSLRVMSGTCTKKTCVCARGCVASINGLTGICTGNT